MRSSPALLAKRRRTTRRQPTSADANRRTAASIGGRRLNRFSTSSVPSPIRIRARLPMSMARASWSGGPSRRRWPPGCAEDGPVRFSQSRLSLLRRVTVRWSSRVQNGAGPSLPFSARASFSKLFLFPHPIMPLRVLILGANGFIGSSLTRAILKQKDWEVYGMDIGEHKLTHSLGDPRFKFVEGDITINREWIEYHVKK